MDRKDFNWWCNRAWIKTGCAITFIMTALILINWRSWSDELKIVAAISALIPVHVLEEWIFPGGFHYQYNSMFNSSELDRYPMCRASDMFTNFITTLFYVFLTVLSCIQGTVTTGVVLGTAIFCLLEFIGHTVFGTRMYLKFKSRGKTTIYGPGSITAYTGFTVFGIILLYTLSDRVITGRDVITAILLLLFITVFCILIPEGIIKKRYKDKYYFENAGYFERFLK